MFGLLPRVVDWLVAWFLGCCGWLLGCLVGCGLSLCLCGLWLGFGWWLDCFAFWVWCVCICCGLVIWWLGGFADYVILLWFVGLCLVFWVCGLLRVLCIMVLISVGFWLAIISFCWALWFICLRSVKVLVYCCICVLVCGFGIVSSGRFGMLVLLNVCFCLGFLVGGL